MLIEYSLNEKKTPLDPAYSDKIIQLIKDAGATTSEAWHDPYGPLPRPAVGNEMVASRLNQEIIDLKERSNVLLEAVRQAGIPDEYTQLVAAYYTNKILEKEGEFNFFNRPMEEIKQELEKGIIARTEERIRNRAQQQNRP
jgi:hypothetical protein